MDMIFKRITNEIKRDFPEFYQENESIIKIIEQYPEITMLYKGIFRRVMLFIEELEELQISQMSRFQRWKTRRDKKKLPLAGKSFDEYVDLLWGFIEAAREARMRPLNDFFARLKKGLKEYSSRNLVNREINYLELYISGEIVAHRNLFNLPSFKHLTGEQCEDIRKKARELLTAELGPYTSELTLNMFKKGMRLFQLQLKMNGLKNSTKGDIAVKEVKMQEYQSEFNQLKEDLEGY